MCECARVCVCLCVRACVWACAVSVSASECVRACETPALADCGAQHARANRYGLEQGVTTQEEKGWREGHTLMKTLGLTSWPR